MFRSFCESEIVGKDSASASASTAQSNDATKSVVITVDPSILQSSATSSISKGISVAIEPSPRSNGKLRVMFCGTYPIGQSNGYSRVVYYISKYLGLKDDIELTIYGFQNFQQTAGSDMRKDISSNVKLHDALATEEPRRNGFGEKEVATYLKANPQDIVIIFNDLTVTAMLVNTIMSELSPFQRKQFKLVSYIDQVYPYQKKEFISMINTHFDGVIAFTPYWRKIAREIGIRKTLPCYVFPHGFDHNIYFPIPRKLARTFFSISEDVFTILNLNRNQPRKRWDHTMMAMADVIKRYYDLVTEYNINVTKPGSEETPKDSKNQKSKKSNKHQSPPQPIKLVIGTAPAGSWEIMDVLEHELKLHGVPFEFGKECIVCIPNPQQLSDRDINILYNACDIGLNTCEGEGFGLCQIEHLAVGSPQVVQRIGGLQEFLTNDNSILVDTKLRYYIDKHRDPIGGIAEVGDPKDFADAIWKYYTDKKLLEKHSKAGRINILQHYRWSTVVDHFHNILKDMPTRL